MVRDNFTQADRPLIVAMERALGEWHTIETLEPFKTVQLYRLTDLYPVVGFYADEPGGELASFMLEEGGPEDGEHRNYPFLTYAPTHWREIPDDLPRPEWAK